MTARFLFDGGPYKRGIDDSRNRVPLTTDEAAMIHHDPELPGAVAPTSISTEFNMQKWSQHLCNLVADDELFIGLLPDAAFYRALWIMSHDALPGFTVTADLVSVRDVYTKFLIDGDATGVTAWSPTTITYDFANGLGTATKDALDQIGIYGGSVSEYRNEDALVATPLATPKMALLGESLYIRLTILTVAPDGTDESGCCNKCNENKLPTVEVGALYDVLSLDKQRVRKFCNCPEDLCKEPCPEPTDAPVTVVLTQTDTHEITAVFSEEVALPDGVVDPEFLFASLPAGFSVSSWNLGSGVTWIATLVYDYEVTAEAELITVSIDVNEAFSVATGTGNDQSNLLEVLVPAEA